MGENLTNEEIEIEGKYDLTECINLIHQVIETGYDCGPSTHCNFINIGKGLLLQEITQLKIYTNHFSYGTMKIGDVQNALQMYIEHGCVNAFDKNMYAYDDNEKCFHANIINAILSYKPLFNNEIFLTIDGIITSSFRLELEYVFLDDLYGDIILEDVSRNIEEITHTFSVEFSEKKSSSVTPAISNETWEKKSSSVIPSNSLSVGKRISTTDVSSIGESIISDTNNESLSFEKNVASKENSLTGTSTSFVIKLESLLGVSNTVNKEGSVSPSYFIDATTQYSLGKLSYKILAGVLMSIFLLVVSFESLMYFRYLYTQPSNLVRDL